MQGITFKHFVLVKQSPVRERNDIIKLFVDKLNAERVGIKYKPLPFVAVQKKCIAMTEAELYSFLVDCEKAKNFSSYFFWSFKKYEKK